MLRSKKQIAEIVQPLNVNDVVSVYEGKAGHCCCGCAGEYFYNPTLVQQIAEYVSEGLLIQPEPKEFSQEKIAFITEFVNRHIEKQPSHRILYGDDDDYGVTYSMGDGLYILELNGLQYHVRTIAEYALQQKILREVRRAENSVLVEQ